MADVASVISSQVDLLWSVALAVLIAEIFLVARFFANRLPDLGRLSLGLLLVSVVSFLASMMFGYFTYGAAVEIVKRAAEEKSVTQSFNDAGMSAFFQFAFFAIGLLTFIVLFALNTRAIGGAIDDGRSG